MKKIIILIVVAIFNFALHAEDYKGKYAKAYIEFLRACRNGDEANQQKWMTEMSFIIRKLSGMHAPEEHEEQRRVDTCARKGITGLIDDGMSLEEKTKRVHTYMNNVEECINDYLKDIGYNEK